jgi:hypothetical protein
MIHINYFYNGKKKKIQQCVSGRNKGSITFFFKLIVPVALCLQWVVPGGTVTKYTRVK